MDLRRGLARAAVSRASVLAVEVPGWASTRWAVERDVRRRGWRTARSPADADVLVTCGAPGARLTAALDLVWDQIPGPRSRITAIDVAMVDRLMNQAAAELLDDARQRNDVAGRPADGGTGTRAVGDEDAPDHRGTASDHAGAGHLDQADMGDMDMGDMDMGDMDMAPDGIPLASGGARDRDGLDLDVLHVPLGPVLPCWPAGLLLHCTMHGDVVAEAHPELLDPAPDAAPMTFSDGTSADRLDRAAHLLLLAGSEDSAAVAVQLRDELLDATDPMRLAPALDRLIRRVSRSRTLRWSLRGLGRTDADLRRAHGIGDGTDGDVYERLLGYLTAARMSLDGHPRPTSPAPVELLAELVRGLELFAARLVVASLDLHTAAARPTGLALP